MHESAYSETVGPSASGGDQLVVAPTRWLGNFAREIGHNGRFSSWVAPSAWGFGGFLIGAIFWHLIGFWGFLSTVVLNGPEARISVVARQSAMPAALPAVLPNCIVLALNRSTGRTHSVPCAETVPFIEEARSGRQNLASAQVRFSDAAPASLLDAQRFSQQ